MSTLRDVARRARVSTATVAGVINGTRVVSAERRKRVLRAVEELDYTINHLARSLHTRRTNLVGMLVPDVSDPFHSSVVRAVEAKLKEAGYRLLLANVYDDAAEQSRFLQMLRTNQVDGMLVYPVAQDLGEIQRLVGMGKPLVLMGRAPRNVQADIVAIDHAAGTRLIVEHLVSKRHHRIGMALGPSAQPFVQKRIEGWRRALKQGELPADESLLACGEFTPEWGASATTQLLALAKPPTAIVAANFHLLIGVLRGLRLRGLKQGRDVEVAVSHDAVALEAFDPPITSVAHPGAALGHQATALLLARIQEQGRPFERHVLAPVLKIRG